MLGFKISKMFGVAFISLMVFMLCANSQNSPFMFVSANQVLYVSPSGVDTNPGTLLQPLKTIQLAVNKSFAGDIVNLLPGHYYQSVSTVRSGMPNASIIINGSSGAIVHGVNLNGNRVFYINRSYITLQGFTIDGYNGTALRNKLIYANDTSGLAEGRLKGVRILYMNITNASGECVHLKNSAEISEIAFNKISSCGIGAVNYNGEGIYIGEARDQGGDDVTEFNWIHNNNIGPNVAECIDLKENATFNLIENNTCNGSIQDTTAGFSIRGVNNTYRYNLVNNSLGAGVRFGGDIVISDGINNNAYNNTIANNQMGGMKFMATPQGRI